MTKALTTTMRERMELLAAQAKFLRIEWNRAHRELLEYLGRPDDKLDAIELATIRIADSDACKAMVTTETELDEIMRGIQ